jgi:hypothetical protein
MKRIAAIVVLLVASGATRAWAHPGWGIVVDRGGRVFYTDLANVWLVETDGTRRVVVPGVHSHELMLDGDGNLWGVHLWYQPPTPSDSREHWWTRVWKRTPDGSVGIVYPADPGAPRGFSLVQDAGGNQYSSWQDSFQNINGPQQYGIFKRTHDGTLAHLAGGAPGHADGRGDQARFSHIGAMTAGPQCSLYLTDSDTVRKITPDGVVTTLASGLAGPIAWYDFGGEGNFNRLMGIAVAPNGDVYVANYGNRQVLKITLSWRSVHRSSRGFLLPAKRCGGRGRLSLRARIWSSDARDGNARSQSHSGRLRDYRGRIPCNHARTDHPSAAARCSPRYRFRRARGYAPRSAEEGTAA